jgi:hypothetical protein
MRVLPQLVAALACVLLACSGALAERRVALVIGNGAYQNVPQLPNPAKDAALIGKALQRAGFTVTLQNDLDHDGLIKALRAFGRAADGADWAVLYYAGHGIEMGGINYLIPVDAKLETDRDVGFEAVPVDQVMSAIEGAHSLRMVILDACRNNPFLAGMEKSAGTGRDIGRGLALVEPEQATLVAYSAKAGTIASDGEGANSPFAAALATHLVEPGVEVDKVFRLVRDDVLDATGRKQEPFVYGSLPGRQSFYFVPPDAGTHSGDLPRPDPGAPQASSAETDYQAAERVGTVAAWDAFLKKHRGDTDEFYAQLAKEARQKLVSLAQPQPQPQPKSNPPAPAQPPAAVEYSYVGPVAPPDPWLALRDQPSPSQGQRLMEMPEGTLFQVLRRQGQWDYVRLRDGTEGWANSAWIQCCKYLPPASEPAKIAYSYVGPVGPPDPWLALRDQPSASQGQRLMEMPEGTLFEVLRQQGAWAYVRLRDGTEGWANSGWIRCCKYSPE